MGSEILWSREFGQSIRNVIITDAGPVLFGEGTLFGIDADNGRSRWSLSSGTLTSGAAVLDAEAMCTIDYVVPDTEIGEMMEMKLGEADGSLVFRKVDLATGESIFETELCKAAVPLQPSPSIVDQTCYVHAFDEARLFAVSTVDGELKWEVDLEQAPTVSFSDLDNQYPPVVIDDTIAVTTAERNVRAYDQRSGDHRFTFEGGPTTDAISLATVEGDPAVLGIGAADGFYGYQVDSGRELWKFPSSGRPNTNVVTVEGEFVVSTSDGTLSTVKPLTGESTRELTIGKNVKWIQSDQTSVYGITSTDSNSIKDKRLLAVDVRRWSRRWTLDFTDPSELIVRPTLICVVANSNDPGQSQSVTGIDPDGGNVVWVFDPETNPKWVGISGKTAIIGTDEGTVYAIREQRLTRRLLGGIIRT